MRSEKSAHRVMETITGYLETELKLKVNRSKSKVSRPTESTLLGFSFYRDRNCWEIRIAPKSLARGTSKRKSTSMEDEKQKESTTRGGRSSHQSEDKDR